MLVARAALRVGQDRLADVVGVPARTISTILRRNHVARLADCDPLTGAVIPASRRTPVRYEHDRPGELVHMDVKKLGRIPDGGGWRARGELVSNHQSRVDKTRIGFDYVHSVVDDHSRLAYSEVSPDEKGPTCAAFLERAIAAFADLGITRIERLITDNARAYRYSLRDVCDRHGIAQKFIRPQLPLAERQGRTLQPHAPDRVGLLADLRLQRRPHRSTCTLADHYNTGRTHSALRGLTPIDRVSPTS